MSPGSDSIPLGIVHRDTAFGAKLSFDAKKSHRVLPPKQSILCDIPNMMMPFLGHIIALGMACGVAVFGKLVMRDLNVLEANYH